MTVGEANNRGWNFAVTAFLAALAIGMLTAIPTEDEFTHKLDEIVIPIVVAAFVAWYFMGRNKFSRSLVPLGAVAVVLVLKAIALFVLEFNDKEDRGDDMASVSSSWRSSSSPHGAISGRRRRQRVNARLVSRGPQVLPICKRRTSTFTVTSRFPGAESSSNSARANGMTPTGWRRPVLTAGRMSRESAPYGRTARSTS